MPVNKQTIPVVEQKPIEFYAGNDFLLDMAVEAPEIPGMNQEAVDKFIRKVCLNLYQSCVRMFTDMVGDVFRLVKPEAMELSLRMGDLSDQATLANRKRDVVAMTEISNKMHACYIKFNSL
jgi:hypothetical protein